MSADMWHALMWLRRFVALWKASSRELSIGPIGSFVVDSALSYRMAHTQKRFYFLFLYVNMHIMSEKSMGFSRLQRPEIHFLFFSTPKSSSRPTMKTSHLINIHPTPVTQPWTLICSFPILSISLSRIYFVSYPPKSSLGFHCWWRWW
jgi:hypothetical protein